MLTEPWRPDDFLTAQQKDSAIAAALNSQTREIKETAEGLKKDAKEAEAETRDERTQAKETAKALGDDAAELAQ